MRLTPQNISLGIEREYWITRFNDLRLPWKEYRFVTVQRIIVVIAFLVTSFHLGSINTLY